MVVGKPTPAHRISYRMQPTKPRGFAPHPTLAEGQGGRMKTSCPLCLALGRYMGVNAKPCGCNAHPFDARLRLRFAAASACSIDTHFTFLAAQEST